MNDRDLLNNLAITIIMLVVVTLSLVFIANLVA